MKFFAWFSCGITSAVACKLAVERFGNDVELLYIETGQAHPDNERFIKDCERWIGGEVKHLRSEKFKSPLDVAEKRSLFNTPYGAPCTLELKKKVRYAYQDKFENVVHVFGFEYSKKEVNRAFRWLEQQSSNAYFPLIENRLTKRDCALILQKEGIDIPAMYKLGYNNNNCIGCFKGGMGYWNKIRVDFPEIFERTAKLEREKKATCLKKDGVQLYLDEIDPKAGRHTDFEMPDCGLFCDLELEGLKVLEIEELMPKLIYKGE